jgi:hypothetical protein
MAAGGRLELLVVLLAFEGCVPEVIPLRPDPASIPAATASPLVEVIPSLSGGSDPMPVRGGRFLFGDLAGATARFAAAAARPWAERHAADRPGGWQMLVEIVRSDAELDDWHLTVEIETRVTLRGARGPIHLGQTRGYCKVSDVISDEPGAGSRVVFQCLERMGRDLAGWLEGLGP